jgi:CheY-like chemotaxis protein
MPGSDTVELVRLLRERTDVPIVMLATESCSELALAAVAAGANAWVRKPFTHESIRAALEVCLPIAAAVTDEERRA